MASQHWLILPNIVLKDRCELNRDHARLLSIIIKVLQNNDWYDWLSTLFDDSDETDEQYCRN